VAAEQTAPAATGNKAAPSSEKPQQGSKFSLTVSLETPDKPAEDNAQGQQEKK
jgi:hypothetical protein